MKSSATKSQTSAKKVLAGQAFLVTSRPASASDPRTPFPRLNKPLVTSLILELGGLVVDLSDVFEIEDAEVNFAMEELAGKGVEKIMLVADQPSTTIKYLVALALGIPCLSWRFLEQCHDEVRLPLSLPNHADLFPFPFRTQFPTWESSRSRPATRVLSPPQRASQAVRPAPTGRHLSLLHLLSLGTSSSDTTRRQLLRRRRHQFGTCDPAFEVLSIPER